MPSLTHTQIQRKAEELSEIRESFRQFHRDNPELYIRELMEAYHNQTGTQVNYNTAYGWIRTERKRREKKVRVAEQHNLRDIREQLALIIRYGPMLLAYARRLDQMRKLKREGKSLRYIAEKYHLSRERVSQILKQIEKLDTDFRS